MTSTDDKRLHKRKKPFSTNNRKKGHTSKRAKKNNKEINRNNVSAE